MCSRRSPVLLGEVRRRHVQLVADQTAVAIENELLLEEMRRHERLDQQLSIGGEIQSQLLPSPAR